MIVNGGSYRCVWWWADHLQSRENDRATVVKSYGPRSENIHDMLNEMGVLAEGTRCQNFFYQMNLNPVPGERLSEAQWDRAREIAEKHHGFEGQAYFVVEHVKHGRAHQHIVWSRIDLENMKAISDSKDARMNHAIAREIEQEFGLQRVKGPYDREPGEPRPKRAPEPWEMYRGMKTGLDPRDIQAEVTELFDQSDSGKAFQAALEEHGYMLVKGDRRGFVILDSAGKEHSLARRIEGVNTKELNAFMRDVDREALPSIEQGRALYQERKIAGLEADRATVEKEIAWEEALAKAAIEKEKVEQRFVEPERGALTGGGQYERKTPAAPELGRTAGQIRLAYCLTDTGQAFADALEDRGLFLARVTQADLGKLEELERRRAEAEKSVHPQKPNGQRTAEAEKAGQSPPRFQENDLVVVNEYGDVHRLTLRNTGDNARTRKEYLKNINHAALPSVTEAWSVLKDLHEHRREEALRAEQEKHWPIHAPQPGPVNRSPRLEFGKAGQAATHDPRVSIPENLRGDAAHIWTAYNRSYDANALAAALDERGILLAVVSKDEADRSHREAAFAKEIGRFAPVYREGEIVAVSESARVYKLNERTTGDDRAGIDRFLKKLDRTQLQGMEATKQVMHDRAEAREAYAQLSAIVNPIKPREPRAIDPRPTGPLGRSMGGREPVKAPAAIGRATERAIAKAFDLAADLFESLFAPALTPEQKLEGQIAAQERQVEAERKIDFSKYTAEHAEAQRNQENQREAIRQQQRDRDRDR